MTQSIPSPEEYAAAQSKLTVGWWYWFVEKALKNGVPKGRWKILTEDYFRPPSETSDPLRSWAETCLTPVLASAQPYNPRTRVGLRCCYRDGYGEARGPMELVPHVSPIRSYEAWRQQGCFTFYVPWKSNGVLDCLPPNKAHDLDLTTAYWPTEQQAEEPVKADDEPGWQARALAAEAELERVTRLHQEAETEAAELRDDLAQTKALLAETAEESKKVDAKLIAARSELALARHELDKLKAEQAERLENIKQRMRGDGEDARLAQLEYTLGAEKIPDDGEVEDCFIVGEDPSDDDLALLGCCTKDGAIRCGPATFAKCKEIAAKWYNNETTKILHIVRIVKTAKRETRLEWVG